MKKVFSPEEANRTLPLVKRIVADIVEQHKAFSATRAEYAKLQSQKSLDPSQKGRKAELESSIKSSVAEMQGYVAELESLGIAIKSFDEGLIDFPSSRDGREVFLCWKHGEDSVEFWHEPDKGYAGRQPIEKAAFSAQ